MRSLMAILFCLILCGCASSTRPCSYSLISLSVQFGGEKTDSDITIWNELKGTNITQYHEIPVDKKTAAGAELKAALK